MTAAPPQRLTLDVALQQALTHHQAQRYYEAEQLYRGILQAVPNHPEACHGLGTLAGEVGHLAEGLPFLKAAVEAAPTQERYWLAYAKALLSAGQAQAALELLDTARRHGVDGAQAQSLRKSAEAARHIPSGVPPEDETAGLIGLFNAGAYIELEERAQMLAGRFPDNGFVWMKLGVALHMQGKEAIVALRRATVLSPEDANVHNALGNVLRDLDQSIEAAESFRRALAVRPDYAEAHNNLGNVLADTGQLAAATASYRRALELRPDFFAAHNNLGNVFRQLGQFDDALASFRCALAIQPESIEAKFNLGLCLLAMGRYLEGWPKYEYRWEGSTPRLLRPMTTLPQWTGQTPRPGDRLLILEEQGFGDKLQFVRYLTLAKAHFPSGVSMVSGHALCTLFRNSFADVEILETAPADQSPWQWQSPLMSLPMAFGTTLETIPGQVPYLVADPQRIGYWKARIDELGLPGTRRRIGIVWQSGKSYKNSHMRNLTLQQLAPLLNLSGCAWFSLQKEKTADQDEWVATGRLIDWTGDFGDFAETAALAANLDMVITVDTSVAHLVGGLALPTWLFNRHVIDWRWPAGEGSAWYPTMKMFRQENADGWDTVVDRMVKALSILPPRRDSTALEAPTL